MKVLICDDDPIISDCLYRDFMSFFSKMYRDIEIDCVTTEEEIDETKDYDICFMDIYLQNNVNGIEIAKKLKRNNAFLLLIFISIKEDLVFDSFSAEPLQFIRKRHYEIDRDDAFIQLDHKLKKYRNFVTVEVDKKLITIPVRDINQVLTVGHDLIIHTKDKDYVIKETLKEFYHNYKETSLVRIQRNLLINMFKIEDIKGNEVYYNQESFKIGRVYKDEFKRKYEDFLKGC